MENLSILPVNPYAHLKHFFGDKFVMLCMKPDGEVGYVIGLDVEVEDMAYISKMIQLISDDFIKNSMGV